MSPTPDASDPTYSVIQAEETCVVIYTSGSTGTPKGVRHCPRSLAAEVSGTDYATSDESPSVFLQASAAGHIAGVTYALRVIHFGLDTVVLDGWDAALAAAAVEKHRVSATVLTPFHLRGLIDEAAAHGNDLQSLQTVIVGGAPVSERLMNDAVGAGLSPARCYGMTEHPSISWSQWDDSYEHRAHTDGSVRAGNRVRIVDELGAVLKPGQVGEVQTSGPELFVGYSNLPIAETFTEDGWFPTGDIGQVTPDGYLIISDRKKNIIIRGGENISLSEVEAVVMRHPSVAEAAVFGVPDERYGERACAFVVMRNGATIDLASLGDHFVREGVAKQKIPEYIINVESLPRGGTGKVLKSALIALWQSSWVDTTSVR